MASLFETHNANIYLAISEADVLRILNSANINIAVIGMQNLSSGLLQQLPIHSNTKFYLIDAPANAIARHTNMHHLTAEWQISDLLAAHSTPKGNYMVMQRQY